MSTITHLVEVPNVRTYTCSDSGCGMEFSILNVSRPSEEYLRENPETPEYRSHFINFADQYVKCFSCGKPVKQSQTKKESK